MTIRRYSAVENFGVPIEKGAFPTDASDILKLMEAYGVEETTVPEDPTDITPYYWSAPELRYFLSRPNSDRDEVVIDFLTVNQNSATVHFGAPEDEPEMRRLVLPTMQESMAITGASPRFAGQLCIHEAILSID